MRKLVVVLVVVLVVATGWWLWAGSRSEPASTQPAPTPTTKADVPSVGSSSTDRTHAATAEDADRRKSRIKQRAERDALRRRILDAMHQREVGAQDTSAASTSTGASDAAAETTGSSQPSMPVGKGGAGGGIEDRTGNHGYLMKAMNEELMPLTEECVQMAREARPDLSGMLVVDVEIIGDEEIGGVVDTVVPGVNNEVLEPELLECVTESILSVTLPPPPRGGRDPISLSMPVAREGD